MRVLSVQAQRLLHPAGQLLTAARIALGLGPAAQVLTPERLNAVYGMDVPAWMRSLYAQWAEDNEKAPLPGELARRSRD